MYIYIHQRRVNHLNVKNPNGSSVLLFYSLIYLKGYLLNFNIVNHVYKKGQVAFLGYVLKPIKVYNLN